MKQNKLGIYSLLTFFLKVYSIKMNKVYIDYKKISIYYKTELYWSIQKNHIQNGNSLNKLLQIFMEQNIDNKSR